MGEDINESELGFDGGVDVNQIFEQMFASGNSPFGGFSFGDGQFGNGGFNGFGGRRGRNHFNFG